MSLRSLNIPVIDFVGKRKFAMIFSAVLLVLSIALYKLSRPKVWN